MPLYEYECSRCGHRFETIQKFSDPPLTTCPKCGGPVHKQQSAPAFQFKGTGWYVTDYAKKGQSAPGKTDAASRESASEKKEGSTDKEAAPKADKPAEKTTTGDASPAPKKD
jgi:putative FmdB family regulatory protein